MEEHIIEMYAALQTNAVGVSYPANQPFINSEKSEIENFKWDHDFITLYHFGPYDFSMPNTYPALLSLHYNNNLRQLNKNQKEILCLGEAVINKSRGKDFENPFVKQIQDSVWTLEKYITDAPTGLIGTQDKENMIGQLDILRARLLKTQNVLEK